MKIIKAQLIIVSIQFQLYFFQLKARLFFE